MEGKTFLEHDSPLVAENSEIKRILYISGVDISEPTGPGVNEREFVIELYNHFGQDAYFVLPAPRGSYDDEMKGANLILCSTFGERGVIEYVPLEWRTYRAAARLLRDCPFDLVVMRLSPIPLAALGLIHRFSNTPFAIKTLGAGFSGLMGKRGVKGILARGLLPFERLLIRRIGKRAVAVDACTEKLLDLAYSDYQISRDKTLLVGNATNTRRFQPQNVEACREILGLQRFDPILGYVGGRPAERGGMQMVEIAPALIERFPNLGIVVVGQGPGMDDLQNHSAALGVAEHCVFPGQVPYDQIPLYVNAFDVGIALDLPERGELAGNSYQKVRQYIACGKPVISTAGGTIDLEAENLGATVDSTDTKDILKAAIHFLSLSAEQRHAHSVHAVHFASIKLSTQVALRNRLDYWKGIVRKKRHLS